MINEQTSNLINTTFQIFLISLWIAIPIVILLTLMYTYKKYKKWESREVKEAERIIVKKNEQILYASTAIQTLEKSKDKLMLDVEELEKKKKELAVELDLNLEQQPEEIKAVEVKELTIKELHDIARTKNIKGFSRMSKEKLIEVLTV